MIDRRSIEPLTQSERIRLAIHLSMCQKCSSYVKYSEFVDAALEQMVKKNLQDSKKQLNEVQKEELVRKLLHEIKK